MRRWAMVLLLLSGCSGGGGPDTPQAACERQADDDPAVRLQLMKAAGSPYVEFNQQAKLREIRQDATLRCLRARGLAPKGSVERPKP